ncbi:MAG: FkbM family methyltransferase [Lachnospiraceae bacterium]|jgi:FkbM family methyltransferase|nr:FkbM family methyltransferase [Lachnospiraceae bacterium]
MATSISALTSEIIERASKDRIKTAYNDLVNHTPARYLCLYGCGNTAKTTIALFERLKIQIDFLCESDGGAHIGGSFCGYKVISFSDLCNIKTQTLVLVSHGKVYECYSILAGNGFPHICWCSWWVLENMETLENLGGGVEEGLCRLKELCSDAESYYVALVVLKNMFSIKMDFNEVNSIYTKEMDEIQHLFELTNGECFADCGAYDGDTVEEFIECVPNYKKIYAIEMDSENYSQLVTNTKNYRDIECFNVGLCDRNGIMSYISTGKTTSVDSLLPQATEKPSDDSQTFVRLAALDDLLDGQPVSFIKMDIEGAELEALRGAETIIREQKPKLAISVYHNPAHIFEVPVLLKQFVPEYKIYFRHHSDSLYETMCYATL